MLIRGYVHEMVISCGAEIIAGHPRSYEREDFVFNPLHYLPLLEQKIGALDQAAPLAGVRSDTLRAIRDLDLSDIDSGAAAALDAIAQLGVRKEKVVIPSG